ncbi:MAG: L,D-transpeptidase family protein [Pseudomonadota bacterium]
MKHNNNTHRITFSAIALAIITGFGVVAPSQAATAAETSVLTTPSSAWIDTVVEDLNTSAIQAHVDLISAGDRLWGMSVLTQLVFEARLRGDKTLESDLDSLVSQAELDNVDRAVTGVVVDFMQRHGFDAGDPQRVGENLVAALQAATLDQYFAAELDALGYEKNLRRALARYNTVADNGGWAQVDLTLVGDDSLGAADIADDDALYSAIQARLAASGDWRGSSIPSARLASANLEFALKRFQVRHQLAATGQLDGATVAAMNVSVYQRIATLQLNLDRALANPASTRRDGVTVNIPSFKASYMRDGDEVWASDVIVGRDGRETPLVESAIDTVVLNPSWWVPRRIARNYILPKVKAKPGYIRSRGFQVLDGAGRPVSLNAGNWTNVVATAQSNLRFRQLPGPQNALGEVKFLFPNRHSVYLHDTNARHLFERVTRAFSSGCVRLAKPMELARVILEQQGFDADAVNAIDASDKTHRVNLDRSVPVRTVYFTADVTRDGSVHFYNDIYDRDGTVIAKAQNTFG